MKGALTYDMWRTSSPPLRAARAVPHVVAQDLAPIASSPPPSADLVPTAAPMAAPPFFSTSPAAISSQRFSSPNIQPPPQTSNSYTKPAEFRISLAKARRFQESRSFFFFLGILDVNLTPGGDDKDGRTGNLIWRKCPHAKGTFM